MKLDIQLIELSLQEELVKIKTDNKKIISWKLREIKEKKLKNENLFKVKKNIILNFSSNYIIKL